MASLHPPLALVAPAHSDIETAHYGSPDNLFLILCCEAFRIYAAAALRAALRQWNRDSFVHARGDGTARLPAIAAAWFAAWPLGVGFWCAARMRCGLAFAGAQRSFQFPAQTFRFLFQAFVFFAQSVIFLLHPIQFAFRDKLDAFRLPVSGALANRFHPTLR